MKLTPCRYCMSKDVISCGSRIRCNSCGRYSIKVKRLDTVSPEERPPCPECRTVKPYSVGRREGIRRYLCRNCGRTYHEESQAENEMPTLEVQEV